MQVKAYPLDLNFQTGDVRSFLGQKNESRFQPKLWLQTDNDGSQTTPYPSSIFQDPQPQISWFTQSIHPKTVLSQVPADVPADVTGHSMLSPSSSLDFLHPNL